MAKHVILESYTFSPSARTIVITGKNIRREQLLLITNVTRGTVIYNFSDPNLGATSYVNEVRNDNGSPLEITTILLAYNTSAHSATDKLSIIVEEHDTQITPAEVMMDPVGKMRMSQPQSLIDTDFEYGIQPTKWETITLLRNRPTAFYDPTVPVPQANITNVLGYGNNFVVVNCTDTVTPNITANSPVFINGTLDQGNVDGWWVVERVTTNVNFSFRVTGTPASQLFDNTKTYVYAGSYYANAGLFVSNIWAQGNVVFIKTRDPHGLTVGNGIWIKNTNGVANLNGTYNVSSTPDSNTFTCNAIPGNFFVSQGPLVPTGWVTSVANIVYNRPIGYVEHRPFDGGVQFSNMSPSPNYQVMRQTRRYFRYQSGKGIQFSTGSILKPSIIVEDITSLGTNVRVATKYQHGLGVGANILVQGVNESGYNGLWTVTSAPNTGSFTYVTNTTPSSTTTTGFPITVSPYKWYGSIVRVGVFDTQNGFFFEYDGQDIFVVRRSSTTQLTGTCTVTAGSPYINGSRTKFSKQVKPNDFIVIRGMSYQILSVVSDTQLIINCEYKGTTAFAVTISKTIDTKFIQSSWNIDKCDGTGASGFNLDLTRMQMFYIDYSWYGAGAIRFGFKNTRGEVIYCHRIVNNNINFEAYMRSGNLPARYETANFPPYTYLTANISNTATTGAAITVNDATRFPNSGTIIVTGAQSNSAPIEYITYSGKSGNTLTLSARTAPGGNSTAQTFVANSQAPVLVELYSPQLAPTINHWGSSIIMDGRYDDDKSLVFNVGQNTSITNRPQNIRFPIISLRISPSVDNGLTGLLGQRELINRMQLVMRQMDAFVTGSAFRIELILNGRPSDGIWLPVGGSSLAQYSLHSTGGTITGGENIFSFFTTNSGTNQQEMNLVRDLGTSIIGGGISQFANVTIGNRYPDGPDMVTLCATPITSATNSINARLSWTEAQA